MGSVSADSFILPALSTSLAQTTLEVAPMRQEVPHVNEVLENKTKQNKTKNSAEGYW